MGQTLNKASLTLLFQIGNGTPHLSGNCHRFSKLCHLDFLSNTTSVAGRLHVFMSLLAMPAAVTLASLNK